MLQCLGFDRLQRYLGFGTLTACALCAVSCLISFNDYPIGELGAGGSRSQSVAHAGRAGLGGGQAGGAGADAAGGSISRADDTVIDDFEDADNLIFESAGRRGNWYGYNDGQGQQTPPPDNIQPILQSVARGTSRRALHFTGSGFTSWGAFVGADFNVGSDGKAQAYKSTHKGIAFWARIEAGSRTAVRLAITTPLTLTSCSTCNDHFAKEVALSTAWQEYFVAFTDVKQDGWGNPQLGKLDASAIVGLRFQYKESTAAFDLWIDDVRFY